MAFSAKVVLDSVAPSGKRLTTMEWTYPRCIHAEFMTHRDRARNAASSRAIPFEQTLARVESDPFVPIQWQEEAGGMQGAGEISEALKPLALLIWRRALSKARECASQLRDIEKTARLAATKRGVTNEATYLWPALKDDERKAILEWLETPIRDDADAEDVKVHKTIPNRLVEPWTWITVLTTATEWSNLWRLRCHPDAEVHFQKIAYMAREAYEASTPVMREWHRPLVTGVDEEELQREVYANTGEAMRLCPGLPSDGSDGGSIVGGVLCRISVARCARVSYYTHEGKRDWRKDLELFDRLVQGSGFGHWSPHEHVAQASADGAERSGPFVGWLQYRKRFAGECG